jgi:hypothetical protein
VPLSVDAASTEAQQVTPLPLSSTFGLELELVDASDGLTAEEAKRLALVVSAAGDVMSKRSSGPHQVSETRASTLPQHRL